MATPSSQSSIPGLLLAGCIAAMGGLWWGHQAALRQLPQRVEVEKQKHQVVSVQGLVGNLHRTYHGLIFFRLGSPGSPPREVAIMPNLGVLPVDPTAGDFLRIDAVERHEKSATTYAPVSAAAVQRLDWMTEAARFPLVPLRSLGAQPTGRLLRLEVVGAGTGYVTTRRGKRHLRFRVADQSGRAEGIMWDGSYSQEAAAALSAHEPLTLLARVERRNDKMSLVGLAVRSSPTAARPAQQSLQHQAVTPAATPSAESHDTVTIKQAAALPEGTEVTLRVRADGASRFQSRNGKTHLRFQVSDDTGQAEGVMWAGSFSEQEEARLASGQRIDLRAEIGRYRGRLSLVGRFVSEAP